jgi:hypothetical protein
VVVVVPQSPSPPPAPNTDDWPSRSEFPPPDPPPPPPPSPDRGFSTQLFAGPGYQRLFHSSIPGAEIGAFFGGVRGISAWYGGFDAFLGRMDYGLFTWAFAMRSMWEARLGRAHVGVTFGPVFAGVQRATDSSMMASVGVGGSAFVTVDLYQADLKALFLGAKLRADVFVGSDASGNAAVLWGPTVAVGWRYR